MSNASSKAPKHVKSAAVAWPWHPSQAVIITIGLFVLSQILAALIALVAVTAYSKLMGWNAVQSRDWSGGTTAQFIALTLAEGLVVLSVFLVLRYRGLSLRRIGLSRPKFRDVWLPIVAFAAYYCLLAAASTVIKLLTSGLNGNQKQDIGFSQAAGLGQLAMVFVVLVVCAPVAEEILFRGFLFTSLRQRRSFVVSTVATSVLFGAAHLAGGTQGIKSPLWSAGLDTLVLSLVLCYLREKTGRLWASILLHAIKNSAAFILLFVHVR